MKTLIQITLWLFIGCLSSSIVVAQSEADQLYRDLGYKKSAEILERKLANNQDLDEDEVVKLANSYRLNHDTENAEKWYAQAVALSDEPINFLHYAQALQSNGNYEMAKEYYLRYDNVSGSNDNRGQRLAAAIGRMNEYQNIYTEIKNESIINSDKLEFSPTYHKDGIVFVSTREGLNNRTKDIWIDDNFMSLFYAQKNTDGSLQSPSEFSYHLSTAYHEGPVTFSKTGDEIFFTRNNYNKGKKVKNRKGVIKLKIFNAEKIGDDWGEATELPFNTDEYDECHPTLSADAQTLFFASNRDGGLGGMDIYKSIRQGNSWSTPVNLGSNINTPGNDLFPFIHDDGTLYFASDGWGGLGGLDIFSSTTSGNDFWAEAMNIGAPFNSPKDDFGFILNMLGTEGYFSSARNGGMGHDDIYSFITSPDSIEKPVNDNAKPTQVINKQPDMVYTTNTNTRRRCVSINGVINDKQYGQRLVAATILLTNNCTGETTTLVSNAVGEFSTDCMDCSCEFTLKASKGSFYSASDVIKINEAKCSSGGVQNIVLKLAPVEDNTSTRSTNTSTSYGTSYGSTYNAPTTTYGGYNTTTNGTYNSGTYINPYDNNIQQGMSIALEDIYYDFDDYRIRNDASRSLDMLADILFKYPNMEIELGAHTDSRGSSEYNQDLSKRRARYAKKYLVKKGIEASRISSQGYGEGQPKKQCDIGSFCSETEHQHNRRTVVRVTKLDRSDIQVTYKNNPPETIDRFNGRN